MSRDRSSLRLALVLSLAFLPATAVAQQPIAEGIDLFITDPAQTFEDLSDLSSLCPGCAVTGDPIIQLEGIPLGMSPVCPGEDLGLTDTIIRRLESTPPLFPEENAIVQIEIVELHLQSVEPFEVNCEGELQNWMLDITVQPGTTPPGQMQIFKVHPNGGHFDSLLPVVPHLTFTRVDDEPPQIVCEHDPFAPWGYQVFGAPWVHDPEDAQVLTIPGCTSNFIAGIQDDSPLPAIVAGFPLGKPGGVLYLFPTPESGTDVPGDGLADSGAKLQISNYPNPFFDLTSIQYVAPQSSIIRATIYNVSGQAIRSFDETLVQAGSHTLDWDGRDDSGRNVSAGIYLYEVRTDRQSAVRKAILLR